MNGSAIARALLNRLNPSRQRRALMPERVAAALYRGILGREPDLSGLAEKADMLRSGDMLERIIQILITSAEFRARYLQSLVPASALPDLTALMPERYERQMVNGGPMTVFVARDDSDMAAMETMIERHRYYDRFGVWTPGIDQDKEITAALVRGLGARSCFELGCFTGPVMSLLADAGVEVLGAEVSHLAFAFAYPNIRDAMLFGDVLNLEIDRVFDVVLCMDVLEHISPARLDDYIGKLLSLMAADGYLYLNSPMWGEDRIFGVFEEPYLDEWHRVGDASFWRHWPCDDRGWPIHGHLIWAGSGWWERKFREYGLVRDVAMETAIHEVLAPVFESAIGRRCLFVLKRENAPASTEADRDRLVRSLSKVPGLPRSGQSQG